MPESNQEERLVEYDRLNWLGKLVFVTGQAARAVEATVDVVIDRAATLITDVERAFRDGLDGRIEDAKVLEEHTRESASGRSRPPESRDAPRP